MLLLVCPKSVAANLLIILDQNPFSTIQILNNIWTKTKLFLSFFWKIKKRIQGIKDIPILLVFCFPFFFLSFSPPFLIYLVLFNLAFRRTCTCTNRPRTIKKLAKICWIYNNSWFNLWNPRYRVIIVMVVRVSRPGILHLMFMISTFNYGAQFIEF